ncbi:MAG: hypothetical protein ACOY71_06820 [Gemmatimonadota bacterium]
MRSGRKPDSSRRGRAEKKHTVIWDRADWERIEAAARKLAEQESDDVGPTNVIRRAVRRYTAELLELA